MADDVYMKMLLEMLERLEKRGEASKEVSDGLTKSKLKLLLIEAVDPELLKELGALMNGKRVHTVMISLILMLGDVVGSSARNDESVCASSEVIADLLHDYAHFCRENKDTSSILRPTHEGNSTPQ